MKTVINIKADKDTKDKAKELAQELGLPLSTIVNAYLKEFVRSQQVHFYIEPTLKPEIGKILKKASRDYKLRESIRGPFETGKEMDYYLDSK